MKPKHHCNHSNSSLATAVGLAPLSRSQAQQLVLEEAMVTAKRRVESLKEMPISNSNNIFALTSRPYSTEVQVRYNS